MSYYDDFSLDNDKNFPPIDNEINIDNFEFNPTTDLDFHFETKSIEPDPTINPNIQDPYTGTYRWAPDIGLNPPGW